MQNIQNDKDKTEKELAILLHLVQQKTVVIQLILLFKQICLIKLRIFIFDVAIINPGRNTKSESIQFFQNFHSIN